MSNQKKDILEKGYAKHGYPADVIPKTLLEIEDAVNHLKVNMNGVILWNCPISDLLTISIDEFIALQCNCCLVRSGLSDFPNDITDTDKSAYVFTSRSENNGIQELIGVQSGCHFSRCLEHGTLTDWIPVQGDTIYFATFDIDDETGELVMLTKPGYAGADFSIVDDDLIVTV